MAIYNPLDTKPFKLSRSKVELFINCPRCFYLDRRLKIGQPPGFPFNLNSAVDSLLKNEFDLYHFSEDINDNKLHFDHELKVGELTTRNGIKLLEISNYPKEIIEESLSISKTLRRYNE